MFKTLHTSTALLFHLFRGNTTSGGLATIVVEVVSRRRCGVPRRRIDEVRVNGLQAAVPGRSGYRADHDNSQRFRR